MVATHSTSEEEPRPINKEDPRLDREGSSDDTVKKGINSDSLQQTQERFAPTRDPEIATMVPRSLDSSSSSSLPPSLPKLMPHQHEQAMDSSQKHDIESSHNLNQQRSDQEEQELCGDTRRSSLWYYSYYHIAVWAILGNLARVVVGRIMGGDCSMLNEQQRQTEPDENNAFVLFPRGNVCLTNNGLTEQTGGALFLDLPANILGCFLMGILIASASFKTKTTTAKVSERTTSDRHAHQRQHDAMFTGMTTGFCGCLTTFSSWNTQMVETIQGKHAALGSQAAAGLFGYFVGFTMSHAAFGYGRGLFEWIRRQGNNTKSDSDLLETDDSSDDEDEEGGHQRSAAPNNNVKLCSWVVLAGQWGVCLIPLTLVVALVSFFIVAATGEGDGHSFYKELVLETGLVPLGAWLRFYLSGQFNRKHQPQKKEDSIDTSQGNHVDRPPSSTFWSKCRRHIPWGTLCANVLACCLAVLLRGLQWRFPLGNDGDKTVGAWLWQLLPAFESGFCGSLSTVSTWIKEIHALVNHEGDGKEKNQTTGVALIYSAGSLLLAMLLGLSIYSAIVES